MRLGVPKETAAGETRVAIVPETVKKLRADGFEVLVEAGAGRGAGIADEAYAAAGATVELDRATVLGADVVVVVNPPTPADAERMKSGALLIGLLRPTAHSEAMRAIASRKVSAVSFDALPRTTRAQAMDVLSSMATVAGYRAALIAAEASPRFFPMLMTAAGTITPASVLVIGAGVAGLQAIATARRLGAVVLSYDLRPAVKEQVESLGARFVELPAAEGEIAAGEAGGYAQEQSEQQQRRQRELLSDTVAKADVVITTAQVPNARAPRIVDQAMVARMKPGSVIVDLAADSGGNCELTKAGERVVTPGGVVVLGPVSLPAAMPFPSSQMFSRNAHALLQEIAPKAKLNLDLGNEIVASALICHAGEILHGPTRQALDRSTLQGAPT